jgi:hypothetical protein
MEFPCPQCNTILSRKNIVKPTWQKPVYYGCPNCSWTCRESPVPGKQVEVAAVTMVLAAIAFIFGAYDDGEILSHLRSFIIAGPSVSFAFAEIQRARTVIKRIQEGTVS